MYKISAKAESLYNQVKASISSNIDQKGYDNFKKSLLGKAEKTDNQAGTEQVSSRADKFDDWGNGKDGLNSSFSMFDFNAETYAGDLAQFSQEYIKKFDEDGDGKMNKSEFMKMAAGGQQVNEEGRQIFERMFANLNIDDDKDTISDKEYASMLFASDIDLSKPVDVQALMNGGLSGVDGKLSNLAQYYTMADSNTGDTELNQQNNKISKALRHIFYNINYKQKEN